METDTELGEITVAQVEAPPENAAAVDANNPTAPARFAFRDIFRKPGYVAVVGLMLIIAKFILDNITIFIFTIMSVVVVGYWQERVKEKLVAKTCPPIRQLLECVASLYILYIIIVPRFVLLEPDFIWKRMTFDSEIDIKFGVLDIFWRVATFDSAVVAFFALIKLVVIFLSYMVIPVGPYKNDIGGHYLFCHLCRTGASVPGNTSRAFDLESGFGSGSQGLADTDTVPLLSDGAEINNTRAVNRRPPFHLPTMPALTPASPSPQAQASGLTSTSALDARSMMSTLELASNAAHSLSDLHSILGNFLHARAGTTTVGADGATATALSSSPNPLAIDTASESSAASAAHSDALFPNWSPTPGHEIHHRSRRPVLQTASAQESDATVAEQSAPRQVTGSANSSDDEGHDSEAPLREQHAERQQASVYLSLRRLLAVLTEYGHIYRLLLPTPLWLVYFSRGESLSTRILPVLYLAAKIFSLMLQVKIAGRVTISFLRGSLEYGHLSTAEELSQVTECSVCYDAPHNPVTLTCSHIFCEGCIHSWLEREKTCPLCRTEVTSNLADAAGRGGDELHCI